MASVAALAAFNPQITPDGAALMRLMASVAASLAAPDLQQASGEAALITLQWVLLELWLDHQQASGEVPLQVMVASVTASLAAQDPQLTPDGVTLAALAVGKHRLAPCWAALVTSVLLRY